MLLSTEVMQKWNPNNKKWYIDKGYEYSQMNDQFAVRVCDLKAGSNVNVTIVCDYCGDHFMKPWYRYIKENMQSDVHMDCCINCRKYKIQDVVAHRYGVASVLMIDSVQAKVKSTNMTRYGCENPFQSEGIKQRIVNTNIQRYGHKHPMQNQAIREKASHTCLQRYGVPYILANYHKSGKMNHRWKGGVLYHRAERSSLEYIEWRKNVFSRDLFTCQCCKRKSSQSSRVTLHAHHIYGWKDNPRFRYELQNGITLCQQCHYGFHSIFGKSKNTMEQLTDFITNHGKKIC